ncbi:post-GPI attachment to proteins factor 3-like [Xenia sp. Carnegie-2017]|uniref:post-GPI attachment to proteins factor 3-like n=1 Tax=Xenia sp. Carnegie-2017 TaxID=2897299 RepID=UPI001F0337F4|nr:post-GPI attachment to proteins factor 3-like [Xenia sp. Carnegie-2017]
MSSYHKCILFTFYSLSWLNSMTSGSSGDRREDFRVCLSYCMTSCRYTETYPGKLPYYLSLFGWKCSDECKYSCMHEITHNSISRGLNVEQFYGKWPFIRLGGIQEPASTIFSIGNALGHYFGWRMYRKHVNPNYSMYSTWWLYNKVSIHAWFWSIIFHTRDLVFTERMDYFCGTSLVLVSIYSYFVRTFGRQHHQRCRFFGLLLFILFICHCGYLSFVRFDYGYNMKVTLAAGLVNVLGWLSWSFYNRISRPYVWKCAFINISLVLLIVLEICDFPPIWGILDAHAVWHLTTIPYCYYWYSFFLDDYFHDEKFGKIP